MNLIETEISVVGDISKQAALDMINAANDSATAQRSTTTIKKPLTHAVWFSLEQVNQMITTLNHEKLMGMGTDGIRVYFGRYTSKSVPKDNEEYLDRDTILFVSTKIHEDGKSHQDYFEHLKTTIEMLPENRGELCQPACTGSQFDPNKPS